MMKPEIKALWIDALRSGDYPQTMGALRSIDKDGDAVGYCCLGVLTELAVEAGVAVRKERAQGFPAVCTYYYSADSSEEWAEGSGLLRSIQEWSGVSSASGHLPEVISGTYVSLDGDRYPEAFDSLISLNDTAGYTFAQIADVIEAQF